MNKIIFSLADTVLEKMSFSISSEHHLSDLYFRKWNIESKNIIDCLSASGLHGGIYSKVRSLANLKVNKHLTVLNIGPETGFETFLLVELFNKVLVCDPDEDNLKLLEEIAKRYQTEKGVLANKRITFLPFGINNKSTFSEEKRIYNSLKESGLNSMPTFYNITSKKEIANLREKFDTVFIHKVLSTMTRSSNIRPDIVFKNAVQILRRKINKNGQISWTEPDAIWGQKDIILKFCRGSIYKYKLADINETYVQIVIQC